jgi:hypothetical protein
MSLVAAMKQREDESGVACTAGRDADADAIV